MIFNINFLPARYGDSIWIEYGNAQNPNIILIDGGTGGTKKEIKELIKFLPVNKKIELLVISHIDRDHIEGILKLLQEDNLDFTIGSIWFNGWNHLPQNPDDEFFGAVQGEKLTAAILDHKLKWNDQFGGKAIVVHENAPLPEVILKDGMRITLLSPTVENLADLRDKWQDEVIKANLAPGYGYKKPKDNSIEQFGSPLPDVDELCKHAFHEDDSVANGSSIAFLAEFENKKVLFAGDSFPSVIHKSLNRLNEENVEVDLVKLSHHASAQNTSPELINKLDCKKFAISTNGSIYQHPSQTTISRIIKMKGPGTQLFFNYKTDHNRCWEAGSLKEKYRYTATYPQSEGIKLSLL
ncbi:ComEC/Rec2 family competence protein [Cognataquiflexum aquatile]|uniref:ComEC/Rec2 family competence protein n=1 Tax=Cognataquiflexum aquatile TaxID=2249427 RepID=UPI000DE868AC|nr:hypothetical protein [Cognataquiflexum aquatile]